MKNKKTIWDMRQSHMPWSAAGAIAVFIVFMIVFNFAK